MERLADCKFFRRGGSAQIEMREREERSCVEEEALPALCGPGLKSARRKQDVKDFQTPARPLTERYI